MVIPDEEDGGEKRYGGGKSDPEGKQSRPVSEENKNIPSAASEQSWCTFLMIWWSLASVSVNPHASRPAFCCISSPEVATPPALAAFPGPLAIPASMKTFPPSGVVGLLAPSPMAMQPFFTSFRASFPVISFSVAEGKATSHGMSQMFPLGMYFVPLWYSQ